MHKQIALIYKLSCSKTPKFSKFRVTDIRDKPVNFLWYPTGVDFSSRNNFANLGSFAKVSISVESIIHWSQVTVTSS